MRFGVAAFVFCWLSSSSTSFGQVGNGVITGTVRDPGGALVTHAAVEAQNAETGVVYSSRSTTAGNYAIADLPVGSYTITASAPGFRTYAHPNLAVSALQVLTQDIVLQIGRAQDVVTVTAQASLLETQTGDLVHNVTIGQLDQLPLLGIGTINAGSSGYRNPYNTLLTLPGVTSYATSGQFTLDGLGQTLTETMRVEGQDSTSRLFGTYQYTQFAQPGADSIQEIAYQTSNYAPEFGQAGSVVINMIMKSGTNQYHGSGYDYFVNEDLNAGDPFTVSPMGGDKLRPRNRRNDFGGTLGGPIYIPRLYDGRNRSFFFFSYEEYIESTAYSFADTLPAPAYLNGDFSAISPNGTCSLCSQYAIPSIALGTPTVQLDPLGNKMYANEIYDPLTRGVATSGPLSGQGFAMPFPGNVIPPARFDPVAVKLNALISSLGVSAQNSNLAQNYTGRILGGRYSAIPAVKIDHNIDTSDKLSFYYSENNTQSQISSPTGSADGLPTEIGQYRGNFITSYTERLNYDRTLTPTLLLHLGAGYLHISSSDRAPFTSFNPSSFGLSGFVQDRQFPSFTGLCTSTFGTAGCSGYGGMQPIGANNQMQSANYEEKPSTTANLTWVRGKHTYKAGAELYLEGIINGTFSGVTFATGTGPTSEPFTPASSFNGYTSGFGYASFLLGDYNSITQTAYTDPREGSQEWGIFAQDSWKVSRKVTMDYGLRWDLATPEQEQYGRLGQLDATLPNPNAGGRLGAVQYASDCGCHFYKPAYPYALGPRIGVAYQLTPKTVFRGGWGVTYQFIGNAAGGLASAPGVNSVSGVNSFVNIETPGAVFQPAWPVNNPYVWPAPGSAPGSPGQVPIVPDGQENRPPRINQFSAGFQREITRNFMIEAAYVGNRAVWVTGPLGYLSQISAQDYANFGLYPYPGTGPCQAGPAGAGTLCSTPAYNNNNDRALLMQPLGSAAVIQNEAKLGITNLLPYSGFPTSQPLQSALYPYPQFGQLAVSASPTGDSKYDSLQTKATKRLSHNLQAGGTFTWAQGFTRPSRQDFFNPAGDRWALQQIPPRVLNFEFIYSVPKASFLPKYLNAITKEWQVGGFANYQSGAFLAPPSSTANPEFLPSEDVRVAGRPLYTAGVNLNNLGTYNPYYTQVLNPAAWAPCSINSVCMAPGNLYKDFRAPRTPTEDANFGRNFRIKERMNLYVRAEFVNIFNRTLMPAPSTINPQNPVVKGAGGGTILTSGFGVIAAYLSPGATYAAPTYATVTPLQGRTGTLIARFSF